MTPGDVSRVYAYCALLDNRKLPDGEEGERVIMAWYSILRAADRDDALEAARRHYSETTDYLTVPHIMAGIRRIAAERRRAVPHETRQLPSRFESDASRQAIQSSGAGAVREVLGPILKRLADKSEAPPSAMDRLRAITADTSTEEEGK